MSSLTINFDSTFPIIFQDTSGSYKTYKTLTESILRNNNISKITVENFNETYHDSKQLKFLFDNVQTEKIKKFYINNCFLSVDNNSSEQLSLFLSLCINLYKLSINSVTVTNYQYLFECIESNKNLQKLEIGSININSLLMKSIVEILKNNKLEELFLPECKINDHVFSILVCGLLKTDSLRFINLEFNYITERGAEYIMEYLKVNTGLKKLYLSGNFIENNGAKYISYGLMENNTLEELLLDTNDIGDIGMYNLLGGLTYNKSLKSLDMSDNLLNENSAEYIADFMKDNYSLHELIISKNKISNDGAKLIAEGIIYNMTMTSLHMEETGITALGEKYIENALRSNRTLLHLRGMKTDGCKKMLSGIGVIQRMTNDFIINRNEKRLSSYIF